MRTRVPVTGTRAWCHQASSRDQRLVSRALNQHFNSNCHLSKSVNYLAIAVCSRGKDKRYKSFWIHIKPVFLDPGCYNLSWSDWMTGGHCSDCWYWNIFVRSLRQAGVTWQSSPVSLRPWPRNMEHLQDEAAPAPGSCSAALGAPANCTMVKVPAAPSSPGPGSAVFTFLRPSPGGKLARIIVYKITV